MTDELAGTSESGITMDTARRWIQRQANEFRTVATWYENRKSHFPSRKCREVFTSPTILPARKLFSGEGQNQGPEITNNNHMSWLHLREDLYVRACSKYCIGYWVNTWQGLNTACQLTVLSKKLACMRSLIFLRNTCILGRNLLSV